MENIETYTLLNSIEYNGTFTYQLDKQLPEDCFLITPDLRNGQVFEVLKKNNTLIVVKLLTINKEEKADSWSTSPGIQYFVIK